ncbi:MAG: acyl-CoA dehydrogenase family protein [Chloroflexi bacterium]|nr:acyl-CoA dehydrogenase family protein [Chloroflexota bacterium]
MDFRFAPADEAFRREVRDFVRKEWDPKGYDTVGASIASYDLHTHEAIDLVKEWQLKLAKKGWWTLHWPTEFGGQAAPISRQLVYREEMAYWGAPSSGASDLVSPVLMFHGNDWHKRELLPHYATAEIEFCRLLSEPGAGSDLASVTTRAVQDGDDFVVTGQKIWTSMAEMADYGQAIVRTDPDAPKHRGLTYLIIDMKTPGITLRPLNDMLGQRRWSEVFLDEVRVPARNMVGEWNRGWYATMTHLSFERSNIGGPARMLRTLEEFIEQAERMKVNGEPILADVRVRHLLADFRLQIEVARMISYRVAWMQTRGEIPVKESSQTKLWGDILHQGIYRGIASLLQDYGLLRPEDPRTPAGRFHGVNAILSTGLSIGGGTREIQKNIIAQRALGLPR